MEGKSQEAKQKKAVDKKHEEAIKRQREREEILQKLGMTDTGDPGEAGPGMARYLMGRRSEEPTPHVIGPKLDEIFTQPVQFKKLLPFLTVDLNAINPAWSGKAHFLHWDYSATYISFKLEDDKYTFYQFGYPNSRSLSGLFKYLEPMEDVNPKKINWDEDKSDWIKSFWSLSTTKNEDSGAFYRGTYLALEPFHLPDRAAFGENDCDWREAASEALKKDPRRFFLYSRKPSSFEDIRRAEDCFFGGRPCWLQGSDTPVDPDGNAMEFVGQVNPSWLSGDLWDGKVYMFYSPKHQLITLVGQCT